MEKIVFVEPVYTYHIDFAGHVSNIVYIQWMEVGRLKLLEAAGMSAHEIMDKAPQRPHRLSAKNRQRFERFLISAQARPS